MNCQETEKIIKCQQVSTDATRSIFVHVSVKSVERGSKRLSHLLSFYRSRN